MLEKVLCPNIAPSPGSGNHPFYKAEHMSPGNSSTKPDKLGIPEKSFKMQFRNAYFQSKVMAQT